LEKYSEENEHVGSPRCVIQFVKGLFLKRLLDRRAASTLKARGRSCVRLRSTDVMERPSKIHDWPHTA
jgi:hypothetical protein